MLLEFVVRIKKLPEIGGSKEVHIGAGHRKRLRDRFLQSGLDGFLDYEIVELLLTLGTPRKDCKQMAKEAIKAFGGLRGVFDTSLEELQQIKGIGPSNAFGIKLFQAISKKYAREKIPNRISLTSPEVVVEYLKEKIGKEKKEHFVFLALDSHNNLISDDDISIGILNSSLIHPREIFVEAIIKRAASVIFAHNHPSGEREPSDADIQITKQLVEGGKLLEIPVLDHIIVTATDYFSFKRNNLI